MGTVMVDVVTPAGIVGDADDLPWREGGHDHDQYIAADDQVVDGPTLENSDHPDHDGETYGKGHDNAQFQRIAGNHGRIIGDDAGFSRDPGGLGADRDQRPVRRP